MAETEGRLTFGARGYYWLLACPKLSRKALFIFYAAANVLTAKYSKIKKIKKIKKTCE